MRANARALEVVRANLVTRHPDSVALMRAGKVVGIFASAQLAQAEGIKRFANRLFSLHELRAHPRRAGNLANL
jgi:hypothetical protein